ncbi:MAG TPA: hypothetical protein VHZ07_12665 [Bryobacteraceae bacterium]|jgi:hypothetical protein|nr:hypothetical protein [Bryobacteraceae bacterium]
MMFFLQDVSDGKPLTASNTLAKLVVNVGLKAYFSASPNPVPNWLLVGRLFLLGRSALGATTLQWNAPTATAVEIHVGSSSGPLLTAGGTAGSVQTGQIVTDGLPFYLQDASNGNPTSAENTLAMLVVHLQQPSAPSLTANPNPIQSFGFGPGTTTLEWNAPPGTAVQIRVGSPDGALFAEGGNSGSATTGAWVTDGMLFYLQDVTDGKPLTTANTLAVLIVRLSN